MKHSGILMPVASLPSPYHVGDFGPDAYRFVRMIKEAGFDVWQVLPLNPLGYGYSPYQCLSSKALDECYISPEILRKEHLISELPPKVRSNTIDYGQAKALKRELLRQAFASFKGSSDYEEFIQNQWVKDYAAFIALKEANDNKCWVEWDNRDKEYGITRDPEIIEQLQAEISFHQFVQYELYHQFNLLRNYVKENGLILVGDMPFYVGIDSDDVYYNRQYFELYGDGRPQWIAGVPPDYFSATGQRWGNPLYNWDELRKNDYDFWFDRIHYSEKLYDILRIDHFRAFDTYWKIDSREETAINGEWIINSGLDFFNKYFTLYPDSNIVAEDLGDLRPEVLELRDHFNLPGMRVLEFDTFGKSKKHEFAYIGTHDNEAMKTWYRELQEDEREKVRKFIRKKFPHDNVLNGLIKYAFLSLQSEFVIISITDILQDSRRINLPGTVGAPNWEYRIRDFRALAQRLCFMKEITSRGFDDEEK